MISTMTVAAMTTSTMMGFEQRDWKIIKRLIETLWLPAHLDHVYTVAK